LCFTLLCYNLRCFVCFVWNDSVLFCLFSCGVTVVVCVQGLLQRDASKRFDMASVQSHAFFAGLEWEVCCGAVWLVVCELVDYGCELVAL
jgi:hypothetical protein